MKTNQLGEFDQEILAVRQILQALGIDYKFNHETYFSNAEQSIYELFSFDNQICQAGFIMAVNMGSNDSHVENPRKSGGTYQLELSFISEKNFQVILILEKCKTEFLRASRSVIMYSWILSEVIQAVFVS